MHVCTAPCILKIKHLTSQVSVHGSQRLPVLQCKSDMCDVGAGDVALVGLDEDALILPGSWGSSQTYPSPSKYTSALLPCHSFAHYYTPDARQLQCQLGESSLHTSEETKLSMQSGLIWSGFCYAFT